MHGMSVPGELLFSPNLGPSKIIFVSETCKPKIISPKFVPWWVIGRKISSRWWCLIIKISKWIINTDNTRCLTDSINISEKKPQLLELSPFVALPAISVDTVATWRSWNSVIGTQTVRISVFNTLYISGGIFHRIEYEQVISLELLYETNNGY